MHQHTEILLKLVHMLLRYHDFLDVAYGDWPPC